MAVSVISQESAIVYRGGKRRWFTLQAAANAEARQRVKERCECERGTFETPAYVCEYHAQKNYLKTQALIERLAGFYKRKYCQASPWLVFTRK